MFLNLKNDFLEVKEEDYNRVIALCDLTDKMVKDSMESVRQWYKMQPHLPQGGLSDDLLFRLLLAVSFRIERTKMKIDNRFTARNIIPEIISQRDATADYYQNALEYVHWGIIPKRLEDMTRVIVSNFTSKDPSNAVLWDLCKATYMLHEYRLSADIFFGDHYIIDLKEVKLGHVNKLTPYHLKTVIFMIQSGLGAKIKGIHYLNIPRFAEILLSIIKAGLSKKLGDRFFSHKDFESLHKVIPKSHLPSDFGGDNKSIKEMAEDLRAELSKQEWRDWFKLQDELKADESKRVGVASDMSNQLLGMHGSFRRLDID